MEFRYIVGRMQEDLVGRVNELIKLVFEQKVDTLVFIDRSARPASWFFEAFWSKTQKNPLPPLVFICTGKKKNLQVNSMTLKQIQLEFASQEKYLKGKRVLIVDDIERDGIQRKFVKQILDELYKPSKIEYFEWNKLGGLRLAHGLSYEDDGGFISVEDESKKEAVEQIKREIKELATSLLKIVAEFVATRRVP